METLRHGDRLRLVAELPYVWRVEYARTLPRPRADPPRKRKSSHQKSQASLVPLELDVKSASFSHIIIPSSRTPRLVLMARLSVTPAHLAKFSHAARESQSQLVVGQTQDEPSKKRKRAMEEADDPVVEADPELEDDVNRTRRTEPDQGSRRKPSVPPLSKKPRLEPESHVRTPVSP